MSGMRTWLMRLKRLKLLRMCVSPCRDRAIRRLYGQYLASEDRQRLIRLKGAHQGQRCFIIGNGPSLRADDLEKLKREFTFAANRIYEVFPETGWRPTVYSVVDMDFLNREAERIRRVPCTHMLLPFRADRWRRRWADGRAIWIWNGPARFDAGDTAPWADRSARIPDDLSLGFSEGRTVTFTAIQMALYMGFQEIYLLGVDFSYSRVIGESGEIRTVDGVTDYFNHKTYDTTLQYDVPVRHAYEAARAHCDAHGVRIRNATRGGKLEVFERVDFDSLFPQ